MPKYSESDANKTRRNLWDKWVKAFNESRDSYLIAFNAPSNTLEETTAYHAYVKKCNERESIYYRVMEENEELWANKFRANQTAIK